MINLKSHSIEKSIKLFTLTKKLLLLITKSFYIFLILLLIYTLLFNVIESGDFFSGRTEILTILWCIILIFPFWMLYAWVKNTKYIGYICTLIIYYALWIYTPIFNIVFRIIRNLLIKMVSWLF
jgi:hypothetical protein